MASFSVTCPKPSALLGSLQHNPNQKQPLRQVSVLFRSDSKSKRALVAAGGFQSSSWKQFDVLRPCALLNEVATEKPSNSESIPETKSEESSKQSTQIPDAASISAFMNQVADLVELVDSRDIMELQLKQVDCEVLIRKKEALPQPPAAAPYVMMQSPSPQPASAPAAAPASAPVPTPPVSAAAPPTPAQPKSSHPPLKCPMAGTFYRCPAPGAPPFVKVGDKVQKGQVICIIEAMKLMNDIEADQSGTVVEILVDDAKPVSVDTPLFIVEP
ncbi:hypothetical protein LguiA_009641 [Lonicera macranthoides]